MRFYTESECRDWLSRSSRKLPNGEDFKTFRAETKDNRAYPLSLMLAKETTYREPVLLWITEWAIWGSNENWHLYYTLRNLRGDYRLLHEAPGHFFLGHETEDLATFLQISLLNGWGGYILTAAGYVDAFFSHDEYINFFATEDSNLSGIREWFS